MASLAFSPPQFDSDNVGVWRAFEKTLSHNPEDRPSIDTLQPSNMDTQKATKMSLLNSDKTSFEQSVPEADSGDQRKSSRYTGSLVVTYWGEASPSPTQGYCE